MNSLNAIAVNVEAFTGNVRPLLYEIRHALDRLAKGETGTTIDLRGLPLAPGEERHIEDALGVGEVRAELQALGPTVVQETAYPGVWLVTHRNADDAIVTRLIEVTRMPEILMAQREDIVDGLQRLDSELQE